MANYLYLLGPTPRLRWLAPVFSVNDAQSRSVGEAHTELFIARHAARCATADGYFKGYGIDHRQRAIAFGPAAAAHLRDPHAEGCFIRIHQRTDGAALKADWFGLMPRMYFCDGGFAAVSDSLAALCEIRRLLGLPVRLNEPALLSRAWTNGAADQLHEELTPIEGIRYCLPSAHLAISVAQGTPQVTTEFESPTTHTEGIDDHYVALLRDAADRIVGMTAALAALPDTHVSLALSGGLDSRVVLAALLHAEEPQRVRLATNAAAGRDAEVAALVAAHVGSPLNAPAPPTTGGTVRPDRLTLWGLFNAGVYDPLFSVNMVREDGEMLTLGGHGAELCKGTYRWKSLEWISRHAGEAEAHYREAVTRGVAPLGVNPNHRGSADWYNVGYRSPLHCGRFTMSGPFGMRPLLDRDLVLMARSPVNHFPEPAPATPSAITDLLIMLSPDLATLPFTKDLKGVDGAHIGERAALLGSLAPAEPYAVVGSPRDMVGGIPEPLLARVAARGFVGGMDAAALRRATTTALERMPATVRSTYAGIGDLAAQLPTGPAAASTPAARAVGKLLTLLLVD